MDVTVAGARCGSITTRRRGDAARTSASWWAGRAVNRPISLPLRGFWPRQAFQPGPGEEDGLVQLLLEQRPRRQVRQVGGDTDAALVELEQLHLLRGFV